MCVLICVHICVRWGARAHNICVEVRGQVHMSILRLHSNCCLRIEFSLACNFARPTFVAYRALPLSATHLALGVHYSAQLLHGIQGSELRSLGWESKHFMDRAISLALTYNLKHRNLPFNLGHSNEFEFCIPDEMAISCLPQK